MPTSTTPRRRVLPRMSAAAVGAGVIAGAVREEWTVWLVVGVLLLGLLALGILTAVLFFPREYPHLRLLRLAHLLRTAAGAEPKSSPEDVVGRQQR